jgi:hypothetical protein
MFSVRITLGKFLCNADVVRDKGDACDGACSFVPPHGLDRLGRILHAWQITMFRYSLRMSHRKNYPAFKGPATL